MGRLYIDSNVFFYAKIMDKVFGKPCAGVIRSIASGSLDASTSALAKSPMRFGSMGEAKMSLKRFVPSILGY